MRKDILIGLFVALAAVQIAVPVFMIRQQEGVLQGGQEFKFRTEPVDPFDAFRGRYVALQLQESEAMAAQGVQFKPGQKVFAAIETGDDGFARLSQVTASAPKDRPYIKARVAFAEDSLVRLDLPIDRYYMPEAMAPKAEELYRQHSSRADPDAYVVVSIKNGMPVVKALFVGGKTVEDALREGLPDPPQEEESVDAAQAPVDPQALEQEIVFLYRTILGREPDPEGLQHWIQERMSGVQLSGVVSGFFSSEEFRGFSVERQVSVLYQLILERDPTAEELKQRTAELADRGSLGGVAVELCFSDEFQAKPAEFQDKIMNQMAVFQVLGGAQ